MHARVHGSQCQRACSFSLSQDASPRVWGCLLRSSQCAGTSAASREGQSSVCVLSSERKYPFPHHKRTTIVFIVRRKNSNGYASTRKIAGFEGISGRRKVTCSKGVDPVLDYHPKLVAIDAEAKHQIMHGRRFGKANGAAHEPFNPGP